jgi:S1-C subfamily serine protease
VTFVRTVLMLALAMAAGCSSRGASRHPRARTATASCSAVGPATDLSYAVSGGTFRDRLDDSRASAHADEILGYLAALDRKLASADGDGAELRDRAARFRELVAARKRAIESSMDAVKASHEVVLAQRNEVGSCQDTKLSELQGAPPKGCESAVRLWRTVERLDPMSEVSSRAVAAHIAELRLEEPTLALRDRLATELLGHADNLAALRQTIHPDGSEADEVGKVWRELERDFDSLRTTCFGEPQRTERVKGSGSKPRSATVVVRPQLPDPIPRLFGSQESFGSGFIVRWRTHDGRLETRIVTNEHVMRGARSAEIYASEDLERSDAKTPGGEEETPVVATLIRSAPYDDIAILRIEDSDEARHMLGHGLALRQRPVDDEEPVLAAGFPGIGHSPSYQVSQGIVSNSRFARDERDELGVTGYIQHTAAIDPGNSGGPLLDRSGRVIGMNTLKVSDRENFALAIPNARIRFAMERADAPSEFGEEHAQAACNLAVAALSTRNPPVEALDRLGLALYDRLEPSAGTSESVRFRETVAGSPSSASDIVRTHIYGAVRGWLEEERGIAPFTRCENVQREVSSHRFTATFETRSGKHDVLLAEEDGLLRVVEIR